MEVEIVLTDRLEVETNLGTAMMPASRLSAIALLWLQGAGFELPRYSRAH